jgi:hypothetical protein
MRLIHDEIMRVSLFRRVNHFFFRSVQAPVLDVAQNRIVKEECFLGNHPDLFTQRGLFDRLDISAIQPDEPRFRFVKSKQQREDRTFSGTAHPNQSVISAGFHMQAEVLHGRRQPRSVPKRHIFDANVAFASGNFDRAGRILDCGLPLQYLKNVIRGIEALLHDKMNSAQLFNRVVEHENARQQGQKLRGTQMRVPHVKERQANSNRRNRFHHRTDDLDRFRIVRY